MRSLSYKSDSNIGYACLFGSPDKIEQTRIYFSNEGIAATVDHDGHVQFFGDGEQVLLTEHVPSKVDGSIGRYSRVWYRAEDGCIYIKFPCYDLIDNYPHCDGEHDRWDVVTRGYNVLKYCVRDNTAQLLREDK